MTAVGITENVKGDQKKFEIWYSGREEVYVVQVGRGAQPWCELERSLHVCAVCQAPSVEVKMSWLHELRRILTDQQKLLRGLQTSWVTLRRMF